MNKSSKDKKVSQKEVIKKVFRYIKKYRIYLYISIILSFVTVLMNLYIPKLTGQAVDYMFAPSQVDFK